MTTDATTTTPAATVDPRAILRAVIAAANAPLLAQRAELEPKLDEARATLEKVLADPAIVAAQEAVNALAARDAELQQQLQTTEDALAALEAPAAPPVVDTPATTTATAGRVAMPFFQAFVSKYRKNITVTQKELTEYCKRAGIKQEDRSPENLLRAYNGLVAQRAA